ncbi:hypothetical protein IKE71_00140 [Candidatus Saccharibacteria bacterium]|nr:hypothetical protein [Candidatus Saccharibacteria bacterium]
MAKNKYGEAIYEMNKKTFVTRCGKVQDNGQNYGTIILADRYYPELLGPYSTRLNVIRVVLGPKGGSADGARNNTETCFKPLNGSFTPSSVNIGPVYMSANYGWSDLERAGYNSINVNLNNIEITEESDGKYNGEVEFRSFLNSPDCSRNGSDNKMYFGFYKITQINHGQPKVDKSGTETNPVTVSIDDKITFTHSLSRNDGWGGNSAEFPEVYSLSGGESWSSFKFGKSEEYIKITEEKSITSLNLEPNKVTKVCSNLIHHNYLGYNGYTPRSREDSVGESEICTYVKLGRTFTATNLGYSAATTSTGQTAYDRTSTLINLPNGYQTSVSGDGGILVSNYSVAFVHKVATVNGEDNNVEFKYKVEQKIDGGSWTTVVNETTIKRKSSGGWLMVRDATGNNAVAFTLDFGESKTVCERLTITPVTSVFGGDGTILTTESGESTSTVCGTITRTTPRSETRKTSVKSTVDASSISATNTEQGEGNIAKFEGNSRLSSYSVNFGHYLKFPAPESPYSYGDQSFTYTVERKVDNGAYAAVSNEKDVSIAVSPDGEYHLLRYNGDVTANIPNFGQTTTVCERVTVKPSEITFFEKGAKAPVPKDSYITSEVCAEINRPIPKTLEITATTSAGLDGANTSNDGTYYVISSDHQLIFYHSFRNDSDTKKTLVTNYKIKYTKTLNGQTETGEKTGKVSAPDRNSNPDVATSPWKLNLKDGDQVRICESVDFTPSNYYLHSDYTLEALNVSGGSKEHCVTIIHPAPTEYEDPSPNPSDAGYNITVDATSTATPASPGTEVSDTPSPSGAYYIKSNTVAVNYAHRLSRRNVVHTDVDSTPTGDVSVYYRFADPSSNFSAASLRSTHVATAAIVKNNSATDWLTSNSTDPLKKANTIVSTVPVSETPTTVCQSIYYLSSRYLSYGTYWSINGVRLKDINPSLSYANKLLRSRIVSVDTVGKSSPACVKLIRPYNFHITEIASHSNETATVVNSGSTTSGSFDITVGKNDPSYLLTDIPNAEIRTIGFVLNNKPANLNGGVTSGDPCALFGNATNCNSNLASETTNIHASNASASGTNYYANGDTYTFTFRTQKFTVPTLATNQKYCLAIAVSPTSSGPSGGVGFSGNFDRTWTVSSASCVNIGKKPTFQIWGGSLMTAGGVKTSTTSVIDGNGNTAYFGSWDDFAIIAAKEAKSPASGATLISGLPSGTYTKCNISPLTIANQKCADDYVGNSGIIRSNTVFKKLYDRYLADPTKYLSRSTLSPADFEAAVALANSNQSPAVIYSESNLYIDTNIYMNGRTNTPNRIYPAFIIAKGDINISPNVINLDAWLISDSGTVNTCADSAGNSLRSSADTCNAPLHIRGAILANKIIFDRTSGADLAEGTIKSPAELIDLSPIYYLYSISESTTDAQPVTTYLRKMPVRY